MWCLPHRSYTDEEIRLAISHWDENDRQVIEEGIACLGCADAEGVMEPVGVGPAGLVFAHPDCEVAL